MRDDIVSSNDLSRSVLEGGETDGKSHPPA